MLKTKKTIITLIILFSSTASFSQFSFGGKLGAASTYLTGLGMQNFMPIPKIKPLGGLIVNYSLAEEIGIQTESLYSGKGFSFYSLAKKIAIQTEFLYSGKGSSFTYEPDNILGKEVVTINQSLGYFSVPVLLQFKIGDRYSYFHIDGGVVFNTLVQHKFSGQSVVTDALGFETTKDITINQTPAKNDLGFAFGFGLYANGLNFDFRYEGGTKKVYTKTDASQLEVLNKSFQVTVGYTFRY